VTAPLSVGIHVPTSAVAALDPGDAYAEFFRQVEALGLDAVWTEDRIFHPANMLDPLMLLGSAAACTRRIQLGTAVAVLTLRNAAVLARQVSTLHHLSGGRLTLGVSLGVVPRSTWASACRWSAAWRSSGRA
jgi:alkanesulfonate monooxygenase SsuD/methylene tetrahydromethanopterin reductase-like flavin-dependent oxidoreductase (luciferase family)